MKREQTQPHAPDEADNGQQNRPADVDDQHIGAREDQVTPTTPPRPDDDEPKQG